jgi:hypothetical protein
MHGSRCFYEAMLQALMVPANALHHSGGGCCKTQGCRCRALTGMGMLA